MVTTVHCPTCSQAVAWVETNTYRPFCSERCKQIDLGAWAQEKYSIPVAPGDDDTDDAIAPEAH